MAVHGGSNPYQDSPRAYQVGAGHKDKNLCWHDCEPRKGLRLQLQVTIVAHTIAPDTGTPPFDSRRRCSPQGHVRKSGLTRGLGSLRGSKGREVLGTHNPPTAAHDPPPPSATQTK